MDQLHSGDRQSESFIVISIGEKGQEGSFVSA